MNERIRELAKEHGFVRWDYDSLSYELKGDIEDLYAFAELIIKECADYVRTNYDSWDAEPLAFNMEKDFGLHGDYAE